MTVPCCLAKSTTQRENYAPPDARMGQDPSLQISREPPHKANGHGRPMVAPTKNVGADSISARARLRQDKLPRAHIECAPTDFAFDQSWFVGNGLDRSVPPCQKYDTAEKPRTAGCTDGSRPIPTNIPRTPSQNKRARATNGRPYKKRRGGFHIRPCPLAAR